MFKPPPKPKTRTLTAFRLTVIVMITPILLAHIHWRTYLLFALVNAAFLPLIYATYPETARRSLEEIDLIFAKGYVEKMGYVRAARELEVLDDEGVDRMARVYGLVGGEEVEEVEKLGVGVEVERGGE